MNRKNRSEFTSHVLSDLNVKQLTEKLNSLKKEFFNLRCQKVLGELTNTSKLFNVKKNIARINTELNKKGV